MKIMNKSISVLNWNLCLILINHLAISVHCIIQIINVYVTCSCIEVAEHYCRDIISKSLSRQ